MKPLRTPILPTLATITAMMIAGCSDPASDTEAAASEKTADVLIAANLGEQVVLPTGDYLKLSRYQNADLEYGRKLAMQCRTCHSFEQRASSPLGPNLRGLFGRRAASLDDFAYSPALAQADFIWTPRALDAWIAAPWRFLPGNRMAYAGLPDQAARDALIAALLHLTEAKVTAEGA